MARVLTAVVAQTAPHKHYVFFRYANPLTEASLKRMKEDGVTRAIAFSQVRMQRTALHVRMVADFDMCE